MIPPEQMANEPFFNKIRIITSRASNSCIIVFSNKQLVSGGYNSFVSIWNNNNRKVALQGRLVKKKKTNDTLSSFSHRQ